MAKYGYNTPYEVHCQEEAIRQTSVIHGAPAKDAGSVSLEAPTCRPQGGNPFKNKKATAVSWCRAQFPIRRQGTCTLMSVIFFLPRVTDGWLTGWWLDVT